MGQLTRFRSCEYHNFIPLDPLRSLIHVASSRKYLTKGPPAASVERVEYIREVDGPDDSVIKELIGGAHKGGFEVRRH